MATRSKARKPVKKVAKKQLAPLKRKCTKCGINRLVKFYATPSARVCDKCKKLTRSASGRKSHLGATYEITAEEYQTMLKRRDGRCWMCDSKRPYNLQVDHDHAVVEFVGIRGSIRGLLCKRCNKLLRDAGDSIMLFSKAIEYLKDGKRMTKRILDPDS